MILSVEVKHHDNPEGDYWFLDTPCNVAETYEMPVVTQPGFHHLEYAIDLTKVIISVHLEGDPSGLVCPYCGQAMGQIHRTLGDALSGPNPYCLHQETEDHYADFLDPHEYGSCEMERQESADEYEPTIEQYIDDYEPPF